MRGWPEKSARKVSAGGLGRAVDLDIGKPHIDDLVGGEDAAQRRGDVGGGLSLGVSVVPRQVLDDGPGVAGLRRFHDAVEGRADGVALAAAGEGEREDNQGESR